MKQKAGIACRSITLGRMFVSDLREVFNFENGTFHNHIKISSTNGIEQLFLQPLSRTTSSITQKRKLAESITTPIDHHIIPPTVGLMSDIMSQHINQMDSHLDEAFKICQLVSLTFQSLGVSVANAYCITCHLKEICPFWKLFPKDIEILVQIALMTHPNVFIPMPCRPNGTNQMLYTFNLDRKAARSVTDPVRGLTMCVMESSDQLATDSSSVQAENLTV